MSLSKVLLFICGIAVGGIAVQALPIAVEWRRDYQATRAVERLKASAASAQLSPGGGIDAEFVPDDGAESAELIVKEYEVPFGAGVQRRRWKLRAPDDVHQQIAAAMIAERGVKLERAFNQSAAAGARQNQHAIQEVELPNLRANITLLNNLITSTTQELVDIEVVKHLAIQRATSTAPIDQAVSAALATDARLKMLRAELSKVDAQFAARKMASRDQNSVEIRLLQRQHDQLESNVAERRDALTEEVKQELAKQPNEKLRAALIEYQIRYKASTSRLAEYREALDRANKRMLTLQRTLDAAKKPPTADSAI